MMRIKEAQANMAYYGFKRVPEEDFSDDGTRFFMWAWDPEGTGKSPFLFSKAGGYGDVFFSDHTWYNSQLHDEIQKRGYHLDDLNGVSKESFTDEALGKIVAQLQEIRQSDWFEAICPEFSTRGAIDAGVEVKDYNADKDHQRVMDIAKRANSDPEKMAKLAANMAKAIGDKEKMRSRWQAAVDVYGSESPVAKAFEAQVKDRGWYINIKPRSGDIDWSSLFESINDESIYKAHAEYEKDQLKKKEEEDNQENFTFDEGSVKLATVVKESIEDSTDTDNFVITDFSDDSYKNAKKVKIADGVTIIKEGAFKNCVNLRSIIIPDSVTSIGQYAFYNCGNLTSITIPNSVTSIGRLAFSNCGLISITIPESITFIEDSTFSGCWALKSITIPNSVTSIGKAAFRNCDNLKSITIPNSVTSIGDNAFHSCYHLTTVILSNSITSIGSAAFYGCWDLKSITIPDGVTHIGVRAFKNCCSLTSITIPNSVTKLRNEVFSGCGLTSIIIPSSVISIGYYAFGSCKNLKSITISNSVTSIGDSAFRFCENLASIRYTGTKDQWDAIKKGRNWNGQLDAFLKNLYFKDYPKDIKINYQGSPISDEDSIELSTVVKESTYWNNFFDKLTESEEPNYFSEGFDAFNRGIRTCPYERGTEAFESWIDGWQDAQMEYEEYYEDCLDESIDNSIKESQERKHWDNFFNKLTESEDIDRTETLLKDYFDTDDVSLSDETCFGLPVYIVDNKRYAVGDNDEAYDAAVQQAIGIFEDDTDEGKIRWLQKNYWPGIDEDSVCDDLGDDPDDYEEGETIYKPSSINEYLDTMGFSDAADAFSMAFIGNYLDKRELGEYVVDSDGLGPLASEDGKEISIGDDLLAFCLGSAY